MWCISHCNMEWIPAVQMEKCHKFTDPAMFVLIICYFIPHFIESFRWDRVFQEKGTFNSNCSEHMSVGIYLILHYEKLERQHVI